MRVVVGLSGGVDSSVAAWLLQQQGHDVVGLFMRNWHDTTGTLSGDCPWEDDQLFAELVARRLDIPFHYVDLSEQYRARVVDYMFAEYARGRTPNPDVLCNREIKFDVFLEEALKLGADRVATGHYCRVEYTTEGVARPADGSCEAGYYRLLAGVDGNKDQSYFLCQLSQDQLSRAIFPIGGMLKPEVRRIAEEQRLATAKRKDSQGICFVGKVDLPTFLQQKLESRRGDIIELPADGGPGRKVGEHGGAHFYTIGQRKGLGVGGHVEPLFVVATDVEKNIVYVGEGDSHPALWSSELRILEEDIHWVRPDRAVAAGASERFSFRIRYRQPLQGGVLRHLPEGGVRIDFDKPQRGVTPGQFAAFYDGEELVGSGVIHE